MVEFKARLRVKRIKDEAAYYQSLHAPSPELYNKLAGIMARSYVSVCTCKKCNRPYNKQYCCHWCGDSNPDMTFEEEELWNRKYGT